MRSRISLRAGCELRRRTHALRSGPGQDGTGRAKRKLCAAAPERDREKGKGIEAKPKEVDEDAVEGEVGGGEEKVGWGRNEEVDARQVGRRMYRRPPSRLRPSPGERCSPTRAGGRAAYSGRVTEATAAPSLLKASIAAPCSRTAVGKPAAALLRARTRTLGRPAYLYVLGMDGDGSSQGTAMLPSGEFDQGVVLARVLARPSTGSPDSLRRPRSIVA
ncbi:hypothetical protein RJ55_02844 [Drechmeria coniospora]|nr:hypothetical protein RJ55_02844 [Drechmeria coniospora]